jgi:SdrD B-like domain
MSNKYFSFLLLSFIAFSKVKAQTSAIGNYVWYDTNRNGIQDPTEVGIGKVLVKLTKPSGVIESISTDANGKYLFSCPSKSIQTLTMSSVNHIMGIK